MPSGGMPCTNTPGVITRSSVVTIGSEWIALIMAESHDLKVKETEGLNAYVILTIVEFGDNAGKSAIVVRAYNECMCCMQELGCKSCDTDPNPLIKPEFRSEVKLEFYSYILCNVDETICIHNDPDGVLIKLNCYMLVKPSSVRWSDVYFGTIWMHMQLHI